MIACIPYLSGVICIYCSNLPLWWFSSAYLTLPKSKNFLDFSAVGRTSYGLTNPMTIKLTQKLISKCLKLERFFNFQSIFYAVENYTRMYFGEINTCYTLSEVYTSNNCICLEVILKTFVWRHFLQIQYLTNSY